MTKNLADELQRTARQALVGLHPVPLGNEQGGLPFRKLLSAVFRFRYLLFATALIGVSIGTFLAITTANTYVSTGTFRFTGSGAEVSEVDTTRATQTSLEAIGTTATYVLSTPGLLSEVVKRVTPERILAPYQPGKPGDSGLKSFFFAIQRDWNATRDEDVSAEEALKRLQKTLTIERPRYTDVLVASCTANDPLLAQEICRVYMDEAIKWHIAKYDDPKAYEKLEESLRQAREALDLSERVLRDFRDGKAGVQDFDAELRRLKENEGAALDLQRKLEGDISVQLALIAQLRESLDPTKGSIRQYVQESRKPDPSDEVAEYVKRKTELNLELTRLRSQGVRDLSDKERQVAEIDATIQRVKEQAAKAAPTVENIENPEWRRATDRLAELQTEQKMMEAKLGVMKEAQGAAGARLKKMLDLEPEYLRLRNARLAAETALKMSQDAWQAAQQKRALSQGLFSSLKEVETASLPLEKEGPNRGKLILGGLLVGVFLGLGLIVLRSLPDDVVRTREDLERLDGLQVIGVMPRLDSRNLKRHSFLRERGW